MREAKGTSTCSQRPTRSGVRFSVCVCVCECVCRGGNRTQTRMRWQPLCVGVDTLYFTPWDLER